METDMVFQTKLVNPDGRQKAIVGAHDRVASGKEFALFSQMLSVMAFGHVPVEGEFDKAGHQICRLITEDELVERAEAVTLLAMQTAYRNSWAVEVADIDRIFDDADEAAPRTGFTSSSDSDDITF
jgi:hypothetical protein